MPAFSIITPSLNQGCFIEEVIQCVLAQQYASFEHIIIDGGSTDETVGILQRYQHLQWISELDEGKTQAINKGFGRVNGDILCWICADDYYLPGAFEKVAACFEKEPELKVVVGRAKVVDENGNWLFD